MTSEHEQWAAADDPDALLAERDEPMTATPPALDEIERLVDHWQQESDALIEAALTDLSRNTGMAAARSTALSEVVTYLRPILARARLSEQPGAES